MRPLPVEPRDRERFLAAVAEQVPVDRVVEVYLFQPLRQGGVESGIAVIAAAGDVPPATESAVVERNAALADAVPPEIEPGSLSVDSPVSGSPADLGLPDAETSEPRYTVFTARYRHVLKGPERGRWEVSVVAEADAPLAAVGAVVRGVQRRAGDADPPEHITGDALRDVLGQARPPDP